MKTKYILIGILLTLGLTSCKKFLDTKPLDVLAPTNYYTTEEHLRYGLAGVYDILGKAPLYAYGMTVRMATEADEGFYYSTNLNTGPQFYDITSSSPDVLNFWTTLYSGISRANGVLENINKPEMDETKRANIKGEALFLRAYYYFLLVSHFGDVPIVLKTASSVEGNDVGRTPANEVYEMITKDMIEAEQLVKTANEAVIGGVINKSAIRGILARVYLYWAGFPNMQTAKYKDARDWAKKVIDDTESAHRLNPSFSDVFVNYAQDKYDIKESIWEVEFSTKGNTRELGQVGSWIGIRSSNNDIGTAYGFIGSTENLYTSYQSGDLRRDRAIANFVYTATGTKTFTASSVVWGRIVGKWRREEETALPKTNQSTPQNFPLLRYSDILLMFAEAENELAGLPTQEAIDAVNLVRKRAWSTGIKTIVVADGGVGYTSAPTVTITGGGGSGAMATAVVTAGKVSSVVLTPDPITGVKLGNDYTSEPIVSFTGGGGSGAMATTTIHHLVDAEVSVMSKEDFKDLIISERSRELCFEGLRKYDLIRWGIHYNTLKQIETDILNRAPSTVKYVALSYTNVQRHHYLFPIPITEINLNKLLVQTPGW